MSQTDRVGLACITQDKHSEPMGLVVITSGVSIWLKTGTTCRLGLAELKLPNSWALGTFCLAPALVIARAKSVEKMGIGSIPTDTKPVGLRCPRHSRTDGFWGCLAGQGLMHAWHDTCDIKRRIGGMHALPTMWWTGEYSQTHWLIRCARLDVIRSGGPARHVLIRPHVLSGMDGARGIHEGLGEQVTPRL